MLAKPQPQPSLAFGIANASVDGTLSTYWSLSGQFHARPGWFGRPVLWVQDMRWVFGPIDDDVPCRTWKPEVRWRRCHIADLHELGIECRLFGGGKND